MPWRLDQLSRRLRLPQLPGCRGPPGAGRARARPGEALQRDGAVRRLGGGADRLRPLAQRVAETSRLPSAWARRRAGRRRCAWPARPRAIPGWPSRGGAGAGAPPGPLPPRLAGGGARSSTPGRSRGSPCSSPGPPGIRSACPTAVVRQAVGEAIPALALPPEAETWSVRHRTAAAWMVAAWADGLHRALEVAERPGMAERLPVPPAAGCLGQRRQDRPPGGLAGGAVPPGHAPGAGPGGAAGGLGGARPRRGWRGCCAWARTTSRRLVSGVLDVVESLRQRNAVPPGPEQHPRWLRRDWGRWRRAAALRAALDHLARSPSSVAVAVATSAGRMHASPPDERLAASGATVALRRTASGHGAGRGRRRGRGARSEQRKRLTAGPRRRAGPRPRTRPCRTPGPPLPGGEGGRAGRERTRRRRPPGGRRAGAQGRGRWGRSRW